MRADKTYNKDHIPVLDGFRGIAVLLVFFSHVFYEMARSVPGINAILYNAGFYGVTLFFLLSGFLVTSPFIKNLAGKGPEVSLKKFYTNRLLRILPLFYISTAFFFVVQMYSEGAASYRHAIPYYLLVMQNISEKINIVNPPTWSISVELHFYLLVGLCFALIKKNTIRRSLIGLVILLVLVNIYKIYAFGLVRAGGNYRDLVYANSFANLDFFISGIVLCMLYYSPGRRDTVRMARILFYAGIAILGFLAYHLHRQFVFHTYNSDIIAVTFSSLITAWAWAFIIRYFLVIDRSPIKKLISSRVLAFYGKISYSLYLLHLPLYTLFYKPYLATHFTTSAWVINISYFVLITFIAYLSYKFIESPFLNLKNRTYSENDAH